jgi:hypothetical protein
MAKPAKKSQSKVKKGSKQVKLSLPVEVYERLLVEAEREGVTLAMYLRLLVMKKTRGDRRGWQQERVDRRLLDLF